MAIRVRGMILGLSSLLLTGCGDLAANVQQALTPAPADVIEADLIARLRTLRIAYPGYSVKAVESKLPGFYGKSAAISLVSKEGSGVTLHLPFEYNFRLDENKIPTIVYHPSDEELRRGVELALSSYRTVYDAAIDAFENEQLISRESLPSYGVSLTMLSLDPARPKTARWHVVLTKDGAEVAGTIVNGYSGQTDEVVVF